ncbi:hypothetical protein OIU79_007269 [Salix purpurea]|uniref:Uncharacterized protein n=1 Tax=Salix purpurea TaxID=77065 RepID=A0A9Q0TXF5_SALPP|nr:hypothetical protein OIU79_007269 [Salix purpurea]
MENMCGIRVRSLTIMIFMAFAVWSSSFDTCIARRGNQWRESRGSSASLAKKKGKNKGNSHHQQHHNGVSKPKPPSQHKAPPLPPAPKVDAPPPPSPPQKSSTAFNVLDFGAKGDGKSDDTKVFISLSLHKCLMMLNIS